MQSDNNQLTRFITGISIIISILVGVSLPIVYGFNAYYDLAASLSFKAKIKAQGQTTLITTMPKTWMYAENRIQGLLQRQPVVLDNEHLVVYGFQGIQVAEAGEGVRWPFIKRSYPLYDIDIVVGKIVISTSLSPMYRDIAKVSFFGVLLGLLIFIVMRLIPIRHLQRISDELYDEKERAVVTLHSISDAVLRTDSEGRIRFINAAGEKMLGRSLKKIKGLPLSSILNITDNSRDLPGVSVLMDALETKLETACNGQSTLEVVGVTIAVEERATPVFDHDGRLTGAVLCLRDVSIARDYLERRSWEASHDALTEILNRRAFEGRISIAIERARNNERTYALCFMDLDRFKVVNDSCGHAAGDDLLIKITELMQSKVRGSDTLARLGGDEFGLLLEGCDEKRGVSIANELIDEIEKFQFFWEKQVYTVGMSIGVTTITNESVNIRDVISEADSACYWAKEHGRNQVHLFLAGDMDLADKRNQTSWVGRITAALKYNQFVLYHQIYRSLRQDGDKRVHLEVLIRMIDEEGGIILPAQFLPAAERYDLIQDIDKWVINKVFSEYKYLADKYLDSGLMVNINLSGASINSGTLLDYIKAKISEYQVDPTSICFEITETVVVTNMNSAIKFINQCQEIGIKFALDDFGTGASSFEYLKNMPVDYLKIDGSFVKDIETDSVDREMLGAINRIGQLLGKTTVAEFAESEGVVDILEEMGIDYAQGYAVSFPTPLFVDSKPAS